MTADTIGLSSSLDAIVIGGGQTGLAAGYYLRRAGLRFAILDASKLAGGAWRQAWDSLHLFSPAEHSSLPGWGMPPQEGETFQGGEPKTSHRTHRCFRFRAY
ncbi:MULTISPECIES: FAD-dependent oxidoreductase [unclassified Leucobacter]|uniref:FAD-dependent oxidoreductase n=1 Tax=unclassified Leucobacter TaxID=2621730 RepID=UPI001930D132|nr:MULTISPECIES: FAD-dependent oxidoreductase [unclassified Leucobacter]